MKRPQTNSIWLEQVILSLAINITLRNLKWHTKWRTKFGQKVVAILSFGTYFLPPRYARVVKKWNSAVEEINCDGLRMILEGRRNDEFSSPILKFAYDE